jgi:pimeloyl-ACP methyl ester carboxylesterase
MRLPRHYAIDAGLRVDVSIGTGQSILLRHGLGGMADFWQPVIERLAGRFTVIAPDLLGFGFSDKPDDVVYTPERHRQAVCAVLEACGVSRLDAVVGHSCGGVIAVSLLAAGEVTTTRLCLAATPYPSPRFPVRAELLRSPRDRAVMTWRPVAQLVHHALMLAWPLLRRVVVRPELQGACVGYMDHTLESYIGTAEACLFRANPDPLLPTLRIIPTLLLYSPNNQTVPFVHGSRLVERLPRSVLRTTRGDHYAVLRLGLPPLLA